MSDGLVSILDGNTFVVSDSRGDIEASMTDPTGLFAYDTRFLSRWVLTVNGQRLTPLSTDDLQYFETRFFLVPGTGTVYVDSKLSVIRRRAVGAAAIDSGEARQRPTFAQPRGRQSMEANLDRWLAEAPKLECDWDALRETYRRSLVDLAALRFSPPILGQRSLPAAGLPWFMTVFGRDSIFTSLQALPFTPSLAATTLRALGDWQGTRVDDFRDEDPGRILHEMRYGELPAFEERPHSPYYGCADATPLFVVLLDEYEQIGR